jgi:3-hydroxymyristoyl/3-hydroxydecanoyl-(acyl carrier protein) dehydratase
MELGHPFSAETQVESTQDTASIRFCVAADYLFLEGHFPGDPIVPAVAQIGWSLSAITHLRGEPLGKYILSRVKFIQVIRPEDDVLLELSWVGLKYSFRVIVREAICSSGVIKLDGGAHV